jgi:hypothetical protein
MTVGNTTQLGIIFEKDNGKYTDDALLYQKILSFPLLGTDHKSFTRWMMCKWLKENHPHFSNRSVNSLQALVGRKIEKLLELQLIYEIGTQPVSKGTGQTSVYEFNSTSYFLGWLIENLCQDTARSNGGVNKIFDILWLMLDTDTASLLNIFFKSLIWKIKVNDLFSSLVSHMIEILESGNLVKDISDLINQTLLFRHVELDLVNKYNELWEETLNELEPKTRQLVMFRMKLLYEHRMKERAYDPAEFEKIRFSAREKFDKIVLECGCLFCQCIRYEVIDLVEYMIRLRYHIRGIPALEKNCPSCNRIDSLQIIDL